MEVSWLAEKEYMLQIHITRRNIMRKIYRKTAALLMTAVIALSGQIQGASYQVPQVQAAQNALNVSSVT